MDLTSLYYLVGIISGLAGGLIFLTKQLNAIKALIYTRTDQLKEVFLSKLDYHERHDDARFESIRNDLWEIRVANAASEARQLSGRPNREKENSNAGKSGS